MKRKIKNFLELFVGFIGMIFSAVITIGVIWLIIQVSFLSGEENNPWFLTILLAFLPLIYLWKTKNKETKIYNVIKNIYTGIYFIISFWIFMFLTEQFGSEYTLPGLIVLVLIIIWTSYNPKNPHEKTIFKKEDDFPHFYLKGLLSEIEYIIQKNNFTELEFMLDELKQPIIKVVEIGKKVEDISNQNHEFVLELKKKIEDKENQNHEWGVEKEEKLKKLKEVNLLWDEYRAESQNAALQFRAKIQYFLNSKIEEQRHKKLKKYLSKLLNAELYLSPEMEEELKKEHM